MPIDPSKKDTVIQLYINGYTLHSIASSENISRPTIRKILRAANVRNVRKSDIDFSSTVNENFFETIDTEEKAYFLGLLFADGCVYFGNQKRKTHVLSINLVEGDKYMLDTFRDWVAPMHKVRFVDKRTNDPTHQNQFRFAVSNKKLTNDLTKLGCTTKKSLTLRFPSVDTNLVHHFIRGYFDGDGCASSYLSKESNRKYAKFSASLMSTKDFCISLGELAKSTLGVNYSLYTRNRNGNNITSELTISGNQQAYKFMAWMYKDATIFLQRKYDKFLELKSQLSY